MNARTKWGIKVERSGAGGEKRLASVGRAVLGAATGVLYLDLLDGEFPLFQKRRQDVPGAVVFSVTRARRVPAPRPGAKTVDYRDVGTLVLPHGGGPGALDLNFLDRVFVVVPQGGADTRPTAPAALHPQEVAA